MSPSALRLWKSLVEYLSITVVMTPAETFNSSQRFLHCIGTIRASPCLSVCFLCYRSICLCRSSSAWLIRGPIFLNYRHNIDQTVITHLCLINLIHKGLQSCHLTSGGLNTGSHHRQHDNTAISILSIIYMISQG